MAPDSKKFGSVRKIWPIEQGLVRDHLLRLDPESRQFRFGNQVSDRFIVAYCDDRADAPGILLGYFIDDSVRAVAELRPLKTTAGNRSAELAISVEQPWQGNGIGTRLVDRALQSARNRGITSLWMMCLRDNMRMQKIARRFAARLSLEPGAVSGTLDMPAPNMFSLWNEGMQESSAVVAAIIDSAVFAPG